MKNNFKVLLITLIVFSFTDNLLIAQEREHKTGARFAFIIQHPLLLGLSEESNEKLSLYQFGIETNWKSKKNKYHHYSFGFLYGRFFNSENPWSGTQSMFEIDYSMFWGARNHHFEIGVGTDNMGLTKLIIGYRLYLIKKILVKAQFIPTSGFLLNWIGGLENVPNFLDFSFGIGYQINQFNSQKVSDVVMFFVRRSSIELEAYLVPFEKDEESPVPPIMFNFGFVPYRNGNFDFIVNGGAGFLSGGGPFYQAGIAIIYGKKRHFLETGVNFIFASLRNPNYYNTNSQYVLPQLQIGYRYRFLKNRMFARIAYAPYIRVLDWKLEGGLQQNAVLGVGLRFGK